MSQEPQQLKLLGIDFGEKRIGLAVWNPSAGLASPLPFLTRKSKKQVLEALGGILRDQEIEGLVLGVPYGLEGQITQMTKNVFFWRDELQKSFDLPLFEVDESLSSQEALSQLRHQSRKKKKTLKDSVSAVIILENFIHQKKA